MDFSADLFTLPTIGGAVPYTLMTIEEVKAYDTKEDMLRMPVILTIPVVNTNEVNTDSKNEYDDVIGRPESLEDIPPDRKVLALNGPAILNVLDDPNTSNYLGYKLFRINESTPVNSLKDILPEQIIFIVFFNTLFFIGKVFGGITQTLDDSFQERFTAVAPALQQGAGDKDRKIYGFSDLTLKDYFDELEQSHNKERKIGYEKFREILVSADPQRVLRYFARGLPSIQSNASTIASRNTAAQMEGIGNNNNATTVIDGEEAAEGARVNLYAESVKGSRKTGASGAAGSGAAASGAAGSGAAASGAADASGAAASGAADASGAGTGRGSGTWQARLGKSTGRNISRKNRKGQPLLAGNYVEFVKKGDRSKKILRGRISDTQDGKGIDDVKIRRLQASSITKYLHNAPYIATIDSIEKMEPHLPQPARFGTSVVHEVSKHTEQLKAMTQTKDELEQARAEAKAERRRMPRTQKEAQSAAESVATDVAIDELQERLSGRARLIGRTNANDRHLKVGDYVEFSPKKGSDGKNRPDNAPKLRGRILEQAFEQEDFVKIVELKDGSLTDLKSDYVYTVDKPRVTKIIPQPTA